MADILQITLPDGTTYNIKDNNALPLTGGQVTGPVTFGDSVSIDDLTVGNIIVTGNTSFVQGIPWSTITGAPTTISGYGITDAVTNVAYDSSTHNITKTINGITSNVVVIPIITGSGTNSAIGGVTSGTNACVASGTDSLAFGINAQAIEECAIALGKDITASGKYSIALGFGAVASGQAATAINGAKATGLTSFALGGNTRGHEPATASNAGAIAIGTNTLASSTYSIALGYQAEASGILSMAIGIQNSATAQCAISIGTGTIAAANYALAMGLGTKASSQSQTALGKFNVEDDQDTYAFIIGNGTADNARSNALTVDWYGNLTTAGTINNYTLSSACEKGVDTSITSGSSSTNLPTTAAVVDFIENGIESKTYTDLIGTTNDAAGASFYFGKIRPDSWDVAWRIKYKIRTYVPGYPTYNQVADVIISGSQASMRAYSSFNTIGANYPAYYHNLYRLKQAGYNSGYNHLLGVGFRGSQNPLNSSYKRTIVINILETENCTFTFYDTCKKYNTTDIPEATTTNYDGLTELNYVSQGLQETGDSNDANYQNRIYYSSSKTKEALYRYQFILRAKDGELIPVSSANDTFTPENSSTLKTYSSQPFDPFGEFYYFNSTSSYVANANIGNYQLYRQILMDLRYGFDVNTSDRKLTARLPVYLIATPQADGSAVLYVPNNSTWGPLTQTLPSTEDGKIYIYLGQAYEDANPYRIELLLNHPVYIYKNGAIRPYLPTDWSEITNKPEYLPLSGGYLSGDVFTNGPTINIGARDPDTSLQVYLQIGGSQTAHGLRSNGYVSSGEFTSDAQWIIYRKTNGKIYIPENYSGNIVWSNQGRKIFVQSGTTVPSSAVAGDIVLVKV